MFNLNKTEAEALLEFITIHLEVVNTEPIVEDIMLRLEEFISE